MPFGECRDSISELAKINNIPDEEIAILQDDERIVEAALCGQMNVIVTCKSEYGIRTIDDYNPIICARDLRLKRESNSSRAMLGNSYEDCLSRMSGAATSLRGTKYRVITLVDSDIMKITRYCVNDGSVQVTCDKSEDRMEITKFSISDSPECEQP